MDQWTEIRRQVLVEGMSKRAACEKYQFHWRTLAKILDHLVHLDKRGTIRLSGH